MTRRRQVRLRIGTPWVLYVLAAINLAVFLAWQLALGSDLLLALMGSNFLVSTEHLASGFVWTLVTSAFSHVDPMHFFFNMFALWVFGREVETVVGRFGFLHLYVMGGVMASLGHVAYMALSGSEAPALGASGSVMAIAVVFAAVFPSRPLLLYFAFPVPAAIAVAGYVLLDVLGVFGGLQDGIAHGAHLGGALYGLLYWLIRVRPGLRRRMSQLIED